jgi:hypothetical protein
MPPATLLRLATRRSIRPLPQTIRSTSIRALSQTSPSFANKYDQDRKSIDTSSSENTRSSTDNAAAADEAAFDPSNTSPEGEMESAGGGKEVSE